MSENPVQNKVVNEALNKKLDKTDIVDGTSYNLNYDSGKAISVKALDKSTPRTLASNINEALHKMKSVNDNPSDYATKIDTSDLNNCTYKSFDYFMYLVDCNMDTLNTPYKKGLTNVPYGECLCMPSSGDLVQLYFTAHQPRGSYCTEKTQIFIRRYESIRWYEWQEVGLERTFYVSDTMSYANSILRTVNPGSLVYIEEEDKMYLYNGTELKQILKSQ